MAGQTRPRRRTRIPLPKTEVEYLILADAAEALNGKLYLMGGGWDTLNVVNFDLPTPIAIACGVVVPWTDTDDEHTLTLSCVDADGNSLATDLSIGFKTGRAPTLPTGAASHTPFAIRADLKFPAAGTYAFVATIDGDAERARRVQFHVRPKN